MGRFEGRHALVTGAPSGIGRACALALVAEGATVSATGRDEERLRRTREESAAPERVHLDAADLSDPVQARRIADGAIAATGTLEVLLNAAGVAPGARVPDGTTLVVDGGQLAGSWYYPWDAQSTGGDR